MAEPNGESLEVQASEAGRRLDLFLAERLSLSRGGARRLLASGAVRVGGRLLAEGPGWLVADKPAGAPVHPLAAGERGTLLGAVAARHPEIQGIGEGGLRSGVVHRLDVDTSGALLFATDAAQWR